MDSPCPLFPTADKNEAPRQKQLALDKHQMEVAAAYREHWENTQHLKVSTKQQLRQWRKRHFPQYRALNVLSKAHLDAKSINCFSLLL